MSRRDALLRLATTLRGRRTDQRKKLATELANLRDFHASYSIGDSADEAFEAGSDEITSQLAELDARQLNQTERALTRLQQGTYGICEGGSPNCQKRIPLARLNALRYTTLIASGIGNSIPRGSAGGIRVAGARSWTRKPRCKTNGSILPLSF